MEKVAPNSNLLGILLKIIRQSKIKGTLTHLSVLLTHLVPHCCPQSVSAAFFAL